MAQGIVPLMGLDSALGALRAAQTPPGAPGWRPAGAITCRPCTTLSEAEGKALLAAAGVPVPRAVSATSLAALQAMAKDLAPPLALKGLGFAHKTEAGAVRLGLASLQGQTEMAGAKGYLAEEMVTGAVADVLLGLRRDPVYGVSLTLGLGGVTAELLADTVTLILPASDDDILAALRRLRLWPLLDGYRGRTRADVGALVAIAQTLGALMLAREALEEIEINPIMVRAQGAVAVDALIRRAL
jgi:hypothetical protein